MFLIDMTFAGGDALVLGRHLSLMKFKPHIYYPKRTDKPLFNNLVTQCTLMDIPFLDACPDVLTATKYKLIADGLFGFSFKPPVRESFRDVMSLMIETDVPIVSVDIPSGWNVETGPEGENSIKPHMLISLTGTESFDRSSSETHNFHFQLQNSARDTSREFTTWADDSFPKSSNKNIN
jgi:hydroxyethylthiazole kinase-like uncharacterized protein yjeF